MPGPYKGRAALVEAFGALDIVDGKIISSTYSDGKTVTGAEWERRNMAIVSDFPGVPRRLYVNRVVVEPLRVALAECIGLRDGYALRTIGCFAPRGKRSNPASLSLHSYGIAVDLNADANGMITGCPAGDPRRAVWRATKGAIPVAWIDAFKRAGWTWGGDFRTAFDPMHFQYASGV